PARDARVRPAGPDPALRLERLTGTAVRDCRAIGGQHGVRHYRAELTDGRAVFAKISAGAPDGGDGAAAARRGPGGGPAGFEAEARGLRWLGEAGAAPVPEVVAWDAAALVISWI